MTKRILFIVLLILSLFFPNSTKAQTQFKIDANVEYKVKETGITTVTHNISLTNLYSNLYATTYQLDLENVDPQSIVALEDEKSLDVSLSKDKTTNSISVSFDKPVVGKGETRKFSIVFDINGLAIKTGEVWEISIPKLKSESAFSNYTLSLFVPESFGQEAYLSPEANSKTTENNYKKYIFTKNQISTSGISAGFGKFQVFSFTLNYHLENPLSKQAKTEIALPPDTSFQKIYYDNIKPSPNGIRIDDDGNWIAEYTLKPRERVDIVATGSVQMFSSERAITTLSDEMFLKYLEPKEYWEVNDPFIQDLAAKLKTPRAIYDFVVTNLKYDYDRVRPNVERLGALKALDNTEIAICMEFTDLFIAIARAVGIPAREINGFAYTENPEIQPLSLVADVLHSWPEYYDLKRQVWVPIDPTWGSTTGGVDFFDKLDLRHFTFVIHGSDSVLPYPPGSYKLGPNPQKDVFVNFGQLPLERISKPKIEASIKKGLFFTDSKLEVLIYNPGPIALYNINPMVFFENEVETEFQINHLLPYSTENFEITIPFSFLGKNTPEKIIIDVEGTRVEVPSNKVQVIVYNLLIIFAAISIVASTIVMRVKKTQVKKWFGNLKEKLTKKEKSENIQDESGGNIQ